MADARFVLRLPARLHAALVSLSKREDRSVNQQIVHLLREAVPDDEPDEPPDDEDKPQ